jgi:hypothetical protein
MQALERQASQLQGLGSDAAEDGMPLLEEGIESSAQTIIVEFVGGHVGEDVSAGHLCPGGDIDQSRRLTQPCRQQNTEHLAMGVFQLRIRWQMAIDNRFNVESLQQRLDQGQRPSIDYILQGRSATPSEGHHRGLSCKEPNKKNGDESRCVIEVRPHSRRTVKQSSAQKK